MNRQRTRWLGFLLAVVMVLAMLPPVPLPVRAADNGLAGKTISILGDSISTFASVSDNPDYNSTLSGGAVYFTPGRWGVNRTDTWWQQTIDALGLELCVNNSWSGSAVLHTRRGTAGAYVSRCVQLHNDHTGQEPDIIVVYMGGNDFNYYQDTLGDANIDYDALIRSNGDGTFTYAEPTTTCEAYAIVLHKIKTRYPDAQVYCMASLPRRDPDKDDGYPDLGQPTAFNAARKEIAARFEIPVVDLENCGISKNAEIFDQYIGDGRTHPNTDGMDLIAQALIRTLLGEEVTLYDVSGEYSGVDTDNGAAAAVSGMPYTADLTARSGYAGMDVTVTMGGADVTDDVYANGRIHIESVTGDITIQASGIREPRNFRWELADGALVSTGENDNSVTRLSGSVTGSVLKDARYRLETAVELRHDRPWAIEWKCAGDWRGVVLSTDPPALAAGRRYLTRTKGGQLCFGTWNGDQYHNFGIDLSGLDSGTHTYRLENRIEADGSNMVWLWVDGEETGPMNRYFIGSRDQGSAADWLNGMDFTFTHIGSDSTLLTDCALSYLQVTECSHAYKNGVCTSCGAAHPNLANIEGKVISILGGSNCTFEGWIPVADGFNLEHRSRYPDASRIPDVTDVSQTWWMQLLTAMDAKLGINDSWAGSQVLNTMDGNSSDLGEKAAMASLTRIQNLGANGTPDVILFFGGCNDIGRGVKLGSFDPAAAPTEADLTTTKWETFADAYVAAITRMRHFYPDAEILVMLPYNSPTYFTASKVERYGAVIRAICDHYGVAYVDLRDSGIDSSHLPDNIHPNAAGCDLITTAVLDALLEKTELEAGAHTVYPVTHHLTNAGASLHYYKGISAGKSFRETISGDNVSVTVTMGGTDITDKAYVDGTISVESVTGPLVITARGRFDADGRLQQLPEAICGGTNLWPLLEHQNEYYTADGWGNNSNSNYSVTIPVTPGDRIRATCFGAAGTNGYSANAVRITWFSEEGVLKSVGRDAVYAEFKANGFVTAPEGAAAVNIPMATDDPSWELFILNLEHPYESVVTQPTCTERGFTSHTCTICGDSYVDSWVDALGHSFGEWKVTTAPTCTEPGQERRDCENCDHYETREVAATGHDYESVVTEPTCTEKGFTTHTCACGETYVDSWVDATGHSWGEWQIVTAPTCTKPGQEQRDCGNCGHYETREVAATGHSYKSVITEPTCTSKGYTTHTCACGDSYVDSWVDALGHSWSEWEVIQEPTATAPGLRQRVCGSCGAAENEAIPQLGIAYGDTNGDGKVNTLDLIILRQYLAGWDVEPDMTAADVNGNGSVNTLDLIILRQYLAGWDVTLGPKS